MSSSTPFNFVSFDGKDENGIRAEVNVQANKGTIKEIKENTAKEVADVHFSVENLKFPIHGWVRTDEPIYELIKAAEASGEEITFRIETQRKANVDRSTPMEELRKDAATARDNVKTILVGINGVLSGEALTNPKEDPKVSRGRYVATDEDVETAGNNGGVAAPAVSVEKILENLKAAASNPQLRSSILDNLAAQALFNGASVEEVNTALVGNDKRDGSQPTEAPRASFSQEAPAWKEYNSDGRLNLGSSVVAAGVGIETLVYKQIHTAELSSAGNIDEVVPYFVDLIFAISDRVQVSSYGEGSRVDRAASSHVRIRGLVYEIIDKTFNLPVEAGAEGNIVATNGGQGIQAWIAAVGKEAVKRFNRAIRASQEVKAFGQITPPQSLVGGSNGTTAALVAPSQPVTAASEAPATPAPETAPEAVAEPEAEIEVEAEVAEPTVPEAVPVEEALSLDAVSDSNDAHEGLEEGIAQAQGIMLPRNLSDEEVADAELATAETIGLLQEMLSDAGFDLKDKGDLVRISRLLAYTFGEGYGNAKKIPDEELTEFIDWYASNGPEAIQQAVVLATGRN